MQITSLSKLKEFLESGYKMEELSCEKSLIEANGNIVYEDDDLYGLLDLMGARLSKKDESTCEISDPSGTFLVNYKDYPNRFGPLSDETILDFNTMREIHQ